MTGDFAFYRDVYRGTIIPEAMYGTCASFAEQWLLPHIEPDAMPSARESTDTKMAVCAIADLLYDKGAQVGDKRLHEAARGYLWRHGVLRRLGR